MAGRSQKGPLTGDPHATRQACKEPPGTFFPASIASRLQCAVWDEDADVDILAAIDRATAYAKRMRPDLFRG